MLLFCIITSWLLLHFLFFFFNDTATTEIYTLSLHDALPISYYDIEFCQTLRVGVGNLLRGERSTKQDRKSTRLNSSHGYISYAVFCLKKKKQTNHYIEPQTTDDSPFALRHRSDRYVRDALQC